MVSHADNARCMYSMLRESSGCPPVLCMEFSKGYYTVETKDGLVLIEEIQASNAWEAKWKCGMVWIEKKKSEEISNKKK